MENEEYDSWEIYYKDTNKVNISIKYTINLPAELTDFIVNDGPFSFRHNGSGEVIVSHKREITKSLFDDVKLFYTSFKETKTIPAKLLMKNPHQYIVGYLGESINKLNSEITKQKYDRGHLLLRKVSQLDIKEIWIEDESGNNYIVLWKKVVPAFPDIKEFKCDNNDVIFVRDLLDSMTEYFYFNFDECIRKIITSLENYFIFYNLNSNRERGVILKLWKSKGSKFKGLINKYITNQYYPFAEDRDLLILRSNILLVYKVRNLIVHDKLRLGSFDSLFCKKAIGTLLYIYQSKFVSQDNKFNYIFSFYLQFQVIDNMFINLNLDNFINSGKKEKTINSPEELSKSIFQSLKITKKQKKCLGR